MHSLSLAHSLTHAPTHFLSLSHNHKVTTLSELVTPKHYKEKHTHHRNHLTPPLSSLLLPPHSLHLLLPPRSRSLLTSSLRTSFSPPSPSLPNSNNNSN